MPARPIIIGRNFERLFAFAEAGFYVSPTGHRSRQSWVRCKCCKEFVVQNNKLTTGHTRSCGCLMVEVCVKRSTHHGHARRLKATRTYRSWSDMIKRCTNPACEAFPNYGGRGITICDRWFTFEHFLADMGECPPKLSIDRYPNNDGNYEPGNTRWATRKQQARNNRHNRVFTVMGLTACLSELCERFHINYDTAFTRLKRGWDVDKAFTTPTVKGRNQYTRVKGETGWSHRTFLRH